MFLSQFEIRLSSVARSDFKNYFSSVKYLGFFFQKNIQPYM